MNLPIRLASLHAISPKVTKTVKLIKSVHHTFMQSHVLPTEAELVKRVPADRQDRFYRLVIWPDLFGGVSLAREYGRIGHKTACPERNANHARPGQHA